MINNKISIKSIHAVTEPLELWMNLIQNIFKGVSPINVWISVDVPVCVAMSGICTPERNVGFCFSLNDMYESTWYLIGKASYAKKRAPTGVI